MNLRTIIGLVAALSIAPAITGRAAAQDNPITPAAPPAAAPKQCLILEEILATPQTEKQVTVFYTFDNTVYDVVGDELVDKKLFAAALPYVRRFYEEHNILVSFVPSLNLEQEQIDGRTRFGLHYASPPRMIVEMLENESITPDNKYFETAVMLISNLEAISFRERAYSIVTSSFESTIRWSRTADKWRWLRSNVTSLEQYGGEVPADGEARLFAYMIAHELGHVFGLPHYCGSDTGNLMSSSDYAGTEISLESGSPFSPQRPLGATVNHLQRALMHSYLDGGAPYHVARHAVDYEAWLTKHGMPVCEEE